MVNLVNCPTCSNIKYINVFMMTKEEVLSILKTHPNGNIEEPQFKKKFPKYYQILSTWNFPSDFKFTQKLFHYFNDDPELKLGLCPVCGNRCMFTKFNRGYKLHCSKDCATKDKNTLIKRKETCINRYGVENTFQSNEKKQKIKDTLYKKYGVDHYSKTNDYKEKFKSTCQERYGVDNYSSLSECRCKVKQTCLERYGKESYAQTDMYKISVHKTSLEKYGVNHFTQSEEYKNHFKDVMIEKYGVEHYSQTKEWTHKKQKKIIYKDISFDSSWELDVFKYCEDNNIPCVYQPDITFKYEYDGKKHYYHPDFLINGKLYEVKGNQFFDGDKMINPYDKTKNKLFESKHQCMIKNNIIILTKDDIKNIKERI